MWIGGIAAAAIAVLGAWTWYDLTAVRADLSSARAQLLHTFSDPGAVATTEGRQTSIAAVDRAIATLGQARQRATGSKALSLLRIVPGAGTQRAGLLELIDDATDGTRAVRTLLGQLDDLASRAQLQDGQVPDQGLAELAADVRATADTVRRTGHADHSLWGPLGDARATFDGFARSSANRLSNGADALAAARTFMGGAGDRHYLVALLNNAEMRDQGMVLSYALARFSGGRLGLDPGGSIHDISLDQPAPTPVPPGSDAVFGPLHPTQLWQSVNATADFSWSGRALVDMYRARTGDAVDGVIAVDVPAIAGLLRAVGPVSIPEVPEPVTADNVGSVLLHDLYEGLAPGSDQSQRREVLSDVVAAVVQNVTHGSRDAVSLGREFGNAARGGHLKLWSAYDDEERIFERTGLGGGPATVTPDSTFHVAVENRTATKLDYYVKPSVHQVVTLLASGDAVVKTTVTVDNRAPVGAAPSYQLGPDEFTTTPGDYRAWVLLWAPAGASMANSVSESGLTLSQHVVPVSAGDKVDVEFETRIPKAVKDGHLRLRLVPQARLEPMAFDVKLDTKGWIVGGARTRTGILDRTAVLDWKVQR